LCGQVLELQIVRYWTTVHSR